MGFRSRRHDDDRRQRPAFTTRSATFVAWSVGVMVAVAGCAQAVASVPLGDSLALSIGRTSLGHPTSRPGIGGPIPTLGSTPTAGSTPRATASPTADPTPLPTGTEGPTPTSRPTPRPTPTPTPNPTPPPSSAPHVLVLMEENKGYAAVLSGAPYLDGLAKTYTSDSSWFGIDHPSAPNYVGFLSGSTQNVVGDCTPPSCGPFAGTSLGGQLSAAGIPWAAYMESMPSSCFTGGSAGLYAEKHNPFVYFNDVLRNGCASHVMPYPGSSALVSTLDGSNAPDFVWITPNLLDDMHDGSVLQGDAWARANLAPILASSWFKNYKSTVIITMDEGDANGSASCCGQPAGGPIPLIIVSNAAAGGGSISVTGDQYGTLRSIEEAYGLSLLGAAANPLNGDMHRYFG